MGYSTVPGRRDDPVSLRPFRSRLPARGGYARKRIATPAIAMRVPATARGLDEAVEEITSGKGRLYDAAVVEACLRVIARSGFSLEAK